MLGANRFLERFHMTEGLAVPADLTMHDLDERSVTGVNHQELEMAHDATDLVVEGGFGSRHPGHQQLAGLPQQPGGAKGGATDHHPGAARDA